MSFHQVGDRINYHFVAGEGRPVLLLHGIANSGRAWVPQVPALVARGYRVIVPDHAGHGASGRLTARFGVADIADDIEALLDQLDIGEVDLVGLSLGGMVALELALRAPGRCRRLVVANSFDRTATPKFAEMAEGWAATFAQPHGPVLRLERTWPSLLSAAFRGSAEGLATYQVWHGVAASADGPSLAHVARGIATFDRADRIADLAMPTLFMAGEGDGMSPPDISRAMAARAPSGRFHLIAGAGHISNVDSADAFNDRLLDFLAASRP